MFNWETSIVTNAKIQFGDTDVSGKGRHFKSRFIQPGVAGYPGHFGNVLITKENLDKFIDTMVGVPVRIKHGDNTTNDDRVGVVNSVWFDDKDGWYWCDGIIWDETAINLIKDKGWNVSCAYKIKEADNAGGTENNISYDMEFLDGVFDHLAIVDNPRYERAQIVLNAKELAKNDKWITIHPNGKDAKGRPLKLEGDETPQEAIERKKADWSTFKKKDEHSQQAKEMSREELIKWQKSNQPTVEQRNAIADYTGDLYIQIGEYLRGNLDKDKYSDGFIEKIKKTVDEIDSVMQPLPQSTQLYNVISKSVLRNVVDDFSLDESIVGRTFSNESFTSTSYTKDNVFYENIERQGVSSPSVLLDIKASKGTKAVFAEPYTLDQDEEREVILDRGLKYKITNVKQSNKGFYVIECEVQKSKERVNNSKREDKMIINALKDFISHVENASNDKGKWITVKGTHVFIPDGKSVDEVMKEKGMDTSSTGKKSESYYRQTVDEDLLAKQNEIQKQKEILLKKLKATDDVAEGDKLLAQMEDLSQKQEQLRQKRLDIDKEAYRKSQDLKGKYERDDVDWDEEQLKKDLKTAQDLGYKEVEDIAEFLGLDEDEVRETLGKGDRSGSSFDEEGFKKFREANKNKNNKTNNSKEIDMTILEELKKLITKVENNKEIDMGDEKIKNEKVDKRKLIDEVAGIMKSAGCDDELIRTAIGKMEKVGYDESEAGTADNKKVKNEDEKKEDKKVENKCKNEDEEDKKKVEEIKEEVKEDVENKCKNSIFNSKENFFEKLNAIYNSANEVKENVSFKTREERLEAGKKF